MTDIALYQSILQKLGQITPQDLSVLDAYLTNLVSKEKQAKKKPQALKSPTYWLEQLAKSDAFAGIENPVEWQRQLRQDRQLSR
ncbi:MAG: hypothetical protein EPO28_03675 [Saprospiraceae bacterium]|nr:MAG: hypothetical protein EPO28_03675 [Saprospiraceae bacterium]